MSFTSSPTVTGSQGLQGLYSETLLGILLEPRTIVSARSKALKFSSSNEFHCRIHHPGGGDSRNDVENLTHEFQVVSRFKEAPSATLNACPQTPVRGHMTDPELLWTASWLRGCVDFAYPVAKRLTQAVTFRRVTPPPPWIFFGDARGDEKKYREK